MLFCYLLSSIFYAVVSGVSGRFVHRLCTWKKTGCPILDIKGAPAYHDTQTCHLVLILVYVSISYFPWWLYLVFLRTFRCSIRVVSMCPHCLQCSQVLSFSLYLTHINVISGMHCLVINFLVLWSICLSWSLVHYKNGTKYLSRAITQVYIPLTRFQQQSFVSCNFLALLRTLF